MKVRNPFVQGVIILLLAFTVAVVANAFASRHRRLLLVGFYPNALRAPPRQPEMVPPPARTETAEPRPAIETSTVTTTTAAPEPAPSTSTQPAVATPKLEAAETKPPANPLARFVPHPDRAAVEISGKDAVLLHRSGALFLDARRSVAYEESHIAGARPFSVWEADIDDKVNALFSERSEPEQQNQPIVIYCTGGACEDSHMLSQRLWGIQFNNVYVYKDGFPDWQKRGGAVRAGGQP